MNSKPSKSAKKREAQGVEALGLQLLALSDQQLAALPLDDELRDVVRATRAMRARSASRRQRLYLARLLRTRDLAALRDALGSLERRDGSERRQFHLAEEWRDRLLNEGSAALAAFADSTGVQNPRLATLLDEREGTRTEARRKRLGREIFREIHTNLAELMHKDAGSG